MVGVLKAGFALLLCCAVFSCYILFFSKVLGNFERFFVLLKNFFFSALTCRWRCRLFCISYRRSVFVSFLFYGFIFLSYALSLVPYSDPYAANIHRKIFLWAIFLRYTIMIFLSIKNYYIQDHKIFYPCKQWV